MLDGLILDKHLPIGFTDLFLEEAARQLWLTETLRTLFVRWGYAPIIPPTVAYAESLSVELGSQMAQDLYRFFDREGHTLALRADLTVPVARIVGTRLCDQPLPLRFFYVGSVFRYVPPQAGQRREFTQAGVELIGADTPQADAEVVALAACALRAIGVKHIRLTLGQMEFFRSLSSELNLVPAQVQRLKEAVDRRNDAYLCAVLEDMALPRPMDRLLRALPTLSGGREVVDRARRLTPVDAAQEALDRLETVFDLLAAHGLDDVVLLDLGEVRGMQYYTGLVFQGYAAGVGIALCQGGRYNDLIGHFGPDLPAVGFAMDVGLARLAVEPAVDLGPDVIVEGCAHSACLAAVQRMREKGVRVAVDTLGRSGDDLVAYAPIREARAIHCLGAGRWQISDRTGRAHEIDVEHIVEEMASW
jgi:ATP phosphoribosyltransferase regulatory subunit